MMYVPLPRSLPKRCEVPVMVLTAIRFYSRVTYVAEKKILLTRQERVGHEELLVLGRDADLQEAPVLLR